MSFRRQPEETAPTASVKPKQTQSYAAPHAGRTTAPRDPQLPHSRPARTAGQQLPDPPGKPSRTALPGADGAVPGSRPGRKAPTSRPEARASRRGRLGLPQRSRCARLAPIPPLPLAPRPRPAAPHLTPSSRRHHPPPRPDAEVRRGGRAGRSGSCSSAAEWRRAASRQADYKSRQSPRRGGGLRTRSANSARRPADWPARGAGRGAALSVGRAAGRHGGRGVQRRGLQPGLRRAPGGAARPAAA